MEKAFERKRTFNQKGRCTEDEVSIGAIVPWAIVAIIALLAGKALVDIPSTVLKLFK